MFAAQRNNLPAIKAIIETTKGLNIPLNINKISPNEISVLMRAILSENFNMIKYLIENGADFNAISIREKMNIFHFAVSSENFQIFEYIKKIAKGKVDINAQTDFLFTPLHCALKIRD